MKAVYIQRGLGDYVIELLNSIVEFVEAHIILSNNDEWFQQYLSPKAGIFMSKAPRVGSLLTIFSLLSIIRYIHRQQPDIIHLQSGVIWELALIKLFPHIPFVITIHDIIKHPVRKSTPSAPQFFLDYGARQAKGIIVHGNTLFRTAQNRYPRQNKIWSINHGIISRYGKNIADVIPKNYGVLFFGGVNAWKGIEYLVECEPFVRYSIPKAKFIIAGFTLDSNYYQNLIRPGQNIEMRLARQTDKDVQALFKWADVLVLPYIEASQSGVLQLGFSFCVPSIVTEVGGLPDVIRHEDNGLIVPPKDPVALARAIVYLMTDIPLRQRIIDKMAIERESRFNWNQIALQTFKAYQEIVRTENHPPIQKDN
jgi:glycosyltransferase involved in cell wall biosynthesis